MDPERNPAQINQASTGPCLLFAQATARLVCCTYKWKEVQIGTNSLEYTTITSTFHIAILRFILMTVREKKY